MDKNWLMITTITLALVPIIDWITVLITKKNESFLSSLWTASGIVFLWIIIATGGILAWLN